MRRAAGGATRRSRGLSGRRVASAVVVAASASVAALAGDEASKGPTKYEFLPVPEGAVARFGPPILGHAGPAMAVAVTRDHVVSAGAEGFVHYWDRRSRGHRSVLWYGEPGGHSFVRLSGDAKRVAYVSSERIFLGDRVAAIAPLAPFERPWYTRRIGEYSKADVTSIALDAEGRAAYWTNGDDLGRATWPLDNGSDGYAVKSACTTYASLVAAGRERVALASFSSVTVKKANPHDDGVSFDPLATARISALWLSSDARTLAAGATSGSVVLWKLADPAVASKTKTSGAAVFAPVDFGPETVRSVALSDDGTTLVVGQPTSVHFLDARTGTQRLAVPVTGNVLACALSADRRTLAAGRADGTIVVWDVANGLAGVSNEAVLGVRPVPLATAEPVAFLARGGIACAADDGSLGVWAADGAPVETIAASAEAGRALAIAPDGSAVLRADGKSLRLEARPSGEARWTMDLVAGLPAAFSEDAQQIAVTEDGKRLVVLDATDGRVIARAPCDGAWWGSQGTFPARGAGAPLVHVDRSGKTHEVVPARPEFGAAACSRDGRLAVVLDRDRGLVTFRDGKIVRQLDADDVRWEGRTTSLAVSDDGSRVAATSSCGNLTVWDAANGAAVARFVDPAYAPIARVVFLAGGRLATCDAYGTATVWDLKRAPK